MNQTWENGKKPNLGPNWPKCDPHPIFVCVCMWILTLLVVGYCFKLLSYAISWKTNKPNFRNGKKPNLVPILDRLAQIWVTQIFIVDFTSASS